jgi:hypothetical protein
MYLDLSLNGISMLDDNRLVLFITVFSVAQIQFILENLTKEGKVLFAADVFL